MVSMGMWKKKFRMFKIKLFWKNNQLFPTCVLFLLACPPLVGNFQRDNPNRTWTFCPLIRSVRYFCPLFSGFFNGFVLILSGLLTFVRSAFGMSANQRFHCIWLKDHIENTGVRNLFKTKFRNPNILQRHIKNQVEHLRWSFFAKIVNDL